MISDFPTIISFLRTHANQEPSRYVRLRAGRARRTADTIWRRDLGEDESVAKVAQEAIDRHSALSSRDKGWLEVIERSPRSPVIDTLPLGEPSEPQEEDGEPDEMAKGEIVTALVQAVLSSTRQLSEENASLRSANAAKDDQLVGMVHKHTELAMQAAKDGVLLTMHEQGFFAPKDEGIVDRIQALIPVIQQVSPHVAAAYASAQAAKARAASPAAVASEPVNAPDRVDAALVEFEAIANDDTLRAAIVEPVRLARLQQAAMRIMAAAQGKG